MCGLARASRVPRPASRVPHAHTHMSHRRPAGTSTTCACRLLGACLLKELSFDTSVIGIVSVTVGFTATAWGDAGRALDSGPGETAPAPTAQPCARARLGLRHPKLPTPTLSHTHDHAHAQHAPPTPTPTHAHAPSPTHSHSHSHANANALTHAYTHGCRCSRKIARWEGGCTRKHPRWCLACEPTRSPTRMPLGGRTTSMPPRCAPSRRLASPPTAPLSRLATRVTAHPVCVPRPLVPRVLPRLDRARVRIVPASGLCSASARGVPRVRSCLEAARPLRRWRAAVPVPVPAPSGPLVCWCVVGPLAGSPPRVSHICVCSRDRARSCRVAARSPSGCGASAVPVRCQCGASVVPVWCQCGASAVQALPFTRLYTKMYSLHPGLKAVSFKSGFFLVSLLG